MSYHNRTIHNKTQNHRRIPIPGNDSSSRFSGMDLLIPCCSLVSGMFFFQSLPDSEFFHFTFTVQKKKNRRLWDLLISEYFQLPYQFYITYYGGWIVQICRSIHTFAFLLQSRSYAGWVHLGTGGYFLSYIGRTSDPIQVAPEGILPWWIHQFHRTHTLQTCVIPLEKFGTSRERLLVRWWPRNLREPRPSILLLHCSRSSDRWFNSISKQDLEKQSLEFVKCLT